MALHFQTAVTAALNAPQGRFMISIARQMLSGGYHTGLTREQAELLVKDCGPEAKLVTLGTDAHAIQHALKGKDMKCLLADLTALRVTVKESLPAKVDAKAYQLDTHTLAPMLMDMTIKQIADMAEQTGVKVVIHNGVVSMGTGKLAIKVDTADGGLLDKNEAEFRAIQGKLHALAYILSKGGKLTKTQKAVLDGAEAANAITPGLFKIPNAVGQLN
jgi:hypothetical protein